MNTNTNTVYGGFRILEANIDLSFDGCTVQEAYAELNAVRYALPKLKFDEDWDFGDCGLEDGNTVVEYRGETTIFEGESALSELLAWLDSTLKPKYDLEHLRGLFVYNDKAVRVGKFDTSDYPASYSPNRPWADFDQSVYDQLEDARAFTNEETDALSEMPTEKFVALIIDAVR